MSAFGGVDLRLRLLFFKRRCGPAVSRLSCSAHVGVVTGSLTSIDGAYVSAAPCLLRPPVQAF